jgi:hypothetical protein
VDSGAHRRAPIGGDGGRGGAALSYARANAMWEECVGRRAGLLARMHTRWLGRLGPRALGTVCGPLDGGRTARPGCRQCACAIARSWARTR